MSKVIGGWAHGHELETSEHNISYSYTKELFPGLYFADVYVFYRGNFYYIGTWVNGTDVEYDGKEYNSFVPFLQPLPRGIHDEY